MSQAVQTARQVACDTEEPPQVMAWHPNEVPVPALLRHQTGPHADPARFKLLCTGRRWGKDIVNVHSAVLGHGPESCPHKPGECQRSHTGGRACWAGLIDGLDVVWVAPDFPQGLTTLWEQEIKPRFAGKAGVTINEQKHSVALRGAGTLHVRSAENIHSVRGLGKRLAGVIVNEAAFLDLETAFRAVIRPALMDRGGWFTASSTTNSGLDGNSERLAPSFFNRLCESVATGERGPEWSIFQGDARANPKIPTYEFDALVAEYSPTDPRLQEEVYAKLLPPGAGLAFPGWEPSVHLLAQYRPFEGDRIVAGMDWGIRAESVILLASIDGDRNLTFFAEWHWTEKDAYEAGFDWGTSVLHSGHPLPEVMFADASMWSKTGIGGKTVGQEFADGVQASMQQWAVTVIPAPHGPGSRAAKLSLWKRGLNWGPRLVDGTLPPSARPTIRFVGHACPYTVKTLPRLPFARNRVDDIDSDAADHGYDAGGNVLVAEYGQGERVAAKIPVGVHPGLTATGRRRERVRTPEVEAAEAMEELAARGLSVGGRYGVGR